MLLRQVDLRQRRLRRLERGQPSAAIQPVDLAFSGDALAAAGSPFTLNLQASNLGNLTIGEWKIDWGDGRPLQTVAGTSSSTTHLYQDNRFCDAIAVTAVDNNGVSHAAALNPGNIDPTFGDGGTALYQIGNWTSPDSISSSAIDGLGRVIAGGYLQDGDFMLLRFDANGALDSSFDGGQVVLSDPGNVAGLAIDPATGAIVVAGCNSGGVYVDSFAGDNGASDGPVQSGITDFTAAAVVAQDGKIYVAGEWWSGSQYQPAVLCFDGGVLVTNFDGSADGVATGSLDGNFTADGLAIQPQTGA